MEKKPYETPHLELLGSVAELTTLTDPCNGSVVGDDFGTQDVICEIPT